MLLNGAGCYDSCDLWDGGQVPLKCLIIQLLVKGWLTILMGVSMPQSSARLCTWTHVSECVNVLFFLHKRKHKVYIRVFIEERGHKV